MGDALIATLCDGSLNGARIFCIVEGVMGLFDRAPRQRGTFPVPAPNGRSRFAFSAGRCCLCSDVHRTRLKTGRRGRRERMCPV